MKPTLAVWMPNYNHAAYIGRAIEAIATQSHRPDEFYIIDDASTDDSVTVIQSYQRRYPFIKLIQNSVNQGVMAIMQRGLAQLGSDYVLMTAADDYILPEFFKSALAMAGRYPQAGIIFGKMRVVNNQDQQLYIGQSSAWSHSLYATPQEYLQQYLEQEAPNQSLSAATIYSLPKLREIGGFRPELGAWCDTFALQALGLRHGVCYVAQEVSVWVVHRSGVSQGIRKNPERMNGAITHAAALMRSPQFQGYFPEEYVRQWLWKYRVTLFAQSIASHLAWTPLGGAVTNFFWQRQYQHVLTLLSAIRSWFRSGRSQS